MAFYDSTSIKKVLTDLKTWLTANLGNKVDKVQGKGLSTEDYTSAEKTKLSGIANGAQVNVQPDWEEADSTSDAYIANKPTIPTAQVNADWNSSSGVSEILHKPTLGTAASKNVGTANGVAELDANGKVPSSQLPSYVDDVIEGYYKEADGKFYEEDTYTTEITGETGKIYISKDTDIQYRWTGSAFAALGGALQLGETSSTAYRGDRGKAAYDFSQTPYTSNPEMNGTASAGSSTAWAKGDHVHPSDTSKLNEACVATEFSTSGVYAVNDLCTKDGVLYRCTTGHTQAAWDASHFTASNVATEFVGVNGTQNIKGVKSFWENVYFDATNRVINVVSLSESIATNEPNALSVSKAYTTGQYLVYQGRLYKVIANISNGAALVFSDSGQNVEATTIGAELAAGSSSGHTIEDGSGTDMTARANLQFIGASVSDDSTNDRTIVDVSDKTDLTVIAGVEATDVTSKAYEIGDRLIYAGKLWRVSAYITSGGYIVTSGVSQNVTETTVDETIKSGTPNVYKHYNISAKSGTVIKLSGFGAFGNDSLGETLLLRERGGETVVFAFGSYYGDAYTDSNYLARRVTDSSTKYITAINVNAQNRDVYVTVAAGGDLDVVQTGGIKADFTYETDATLPAYSQNVPIVDIDVSTKADIVDLASAFDTTTAYTVGQYVTYNGDLYKCTTNHSAGAWNSSHFTAVTVGNELYYNQPWVGTTTDWTALSATEKAKYKEVHFTDDVVNQNVDQTPTSGSQHLVTSGGVYSALNECVKLTGNQTVHGEKQFDKVKFLYDDSASEPPTASIKNGEIAADTDGIRIKSRNVSGFDNVSRIYLDTQTVVIGENDASGAGKIYSNETEIASGMGSTIISSENGNVIVNLNDTYGGDSFKINAYKTGNTTTQQRVFEVDNDGNVTAVGSFEVPNADYAERFPVLEDIPDYRFVTLNGEAVKLAQSDTDFEDIVGVRSVKPAIIGDKDLNGIEIGLLGKLWVEHDGTAVVNGYVKSGDNGIATRAKKGEGYRVMAVNGNKCRVLVK